MAKVMLEKVSKSFGELTVVKEVDLEIKDGEFLVLVGPSGCGKTTTLRMIAGLEEISAGNIYIGDRRVNDLPPRDRDIAMVFQNYALYPHMNVDDNMSFGLRLRKVPREEIKRRVEKAAAMLGINHLLQRKPRELSGGQRQRVALGRAIVREPQAFLMDEPLSNLDAKLRVQMRVELEKLHSRLKTTIIYVTHDQVESMAMADRIAVMNLGEIQQIGTPLDIYHHPFNEFVAGFIGEPPANFVDCDVIREGGKYFITCPAFRFELNDVWAKRFAANFRQRIRLGVRPEDICISFTENKNCCGLEVDFVEIQGDRTIITLKVEDRLFLSEVLGDVRPEIGQTIYVEFNQEHIHFFSLEDGKNVFFDEEMKN